MIKGKWIIESVEGFTQKADKNCPECHESMRYLNIFISPENPKSIDTKKEAMDLPKKTEKNQDDVASEDIKLKLRCLWCPKCKALQFRE